MEQKLTPKTDERGTLLEIFKIPGTGQVFYATSVPGAIRGDHYHTRKRETFCVVEGEGRISMRDRESGATKAYTVSGENPETVEMPLNWVHNIENIGEGEMKLVVWTNEVYDPNDPDTYPEKV